MKKSLYCIVALFGTVSLFAQTIDEQIKGAINASPQERVRLMNQLKLQISTMNQDKQADAIRSLQRQMGTNHEMGTNGMQQHRVMQQSQTSEQNHQQIMMRLQNGSQDNGGRQNGRQ